MQELFAEGSVGDFAFRELRLGEVVAQSGLLHCLADGSFGVVFLYTGGGESVLVEPGERIVELYVGGGVTGRKLRGQGGVDLRFEFAGVEIGGGDAELLRGIGQG